MTGPERDRRLLLLRHADAATGFGLGLDDHARPLTDGGRCDADAMGRWLGGQRLSPDLVVCSTAARTRQTWAAAATSIDPAGHVLWSDAVYGGGVQAVLEVVREEGGPAGTVLVVGHAPTMPHLADLLSDGAGEQDARSALAAGFPTCSIAVLAYAGPWADLGPGTARLEQVHVARA